MMSAVDDGTSRSDKSFDIKCSDYDDVNFRVCYIPTSRTARTTIKGFFNSRVKYYD